MAWPLAGCGLAVLPTSRVAVSCPLASGTARSYRIALGMTTETNFPGTSDS